MKQLITIILLLSCILLLDSCTGRLHPFSVNAVPESKSDFQVVENLTDQFKLGGVIAFVVRKGTHHYIFIDTGYNITFEHDQDCPNHQNRLMERAKENELRREGF